MTFLAWVSRISTFHSMSAVLEVVMVVVVVDSSAASTSLMGALRLSEVSEGLLALHAYEHSLEYALDGSYHVSVTVPCRAKHSRIKKPHTDLAIPQ